ncbi:2-amino-4-hydroxy-6-hydroxymethyldihydropteridine diphosphokinase [Aliidiomarina sp. Khilg15.8]
MSSPHYYYLALGSNLRPAHNIALGLRLLQDEFEQILVWPVVETPPTAMATEKQFYNTLVVVRSMLTPDALKNFCNQIEMKLGRDRNDPLSSFKDRPLDIDIMARQQHLDAAVTNQFDEPYVRAVVQAGLRPNGECRRITLGHHHLGETASTIYTDHTARHVMVIEDGINSLFERFKTTFHSE